MVTAIVLINARRESIPETAEALTHLKGVAEVYSVAGEWDLVAIIRVPSNDDLAELVTGHMLKFGGIVKTRTLVAFRTHSRYDLEHMFSIGLEEKPEGAAK